MSGVGDFIHYSIFPINRHFHTAKKQVAFSTATHKNVELAHDSRSQRFGMGIAKLELDKDENKNDKPSGENYI